MLDVPKSLTLFHGEGSNCCQRVKWILAYKDVRHETVDVAPFSDAEMLALTPLGQVPSLKIEDNSLTESMAIAEFLEEAYPTPNLFPKDRLLRAHVRELCEAINTFVHPVQRTRVVKYFRPEVDKATITVLRLNWLEHSLTTVESMLRDQESFAVAGCFTLADIFIVPVYVKYLGMGGAADRLPRLASLLSACTGDAQVLASAPSDLQLG